MGLRHSFAKKLGWLLLVLCQIAIAEPEFITFPSDIDWVTRRSENFTALYRRGQDSLAVRSLKAAERAHQLLSPIFPKGPENTWMVIADWTDSTNGYSLNIPWPHFVIFAAPPLVTGELATLDNWLDSVILHEYVHTLHTYPASGLWSPLRFIFGAWVLPNLFMPGHLIEGIATYYETEMSRGGRGRSALFKMYRRKAVEAKKWGDEFVPLDMLEGTSTTWPHGASRYFFGYYLHQTLGRKKGHKGLGQLTESFSSNWPYLIHTPFNEVYGKDLGELWDEAFEESRKESQQELTRLQREPLSQLKYLTQSRFFKRDVTLSGDKKYAAYRAAAPYKKLHVAVMNLKTKKVIKEIDVGGGGSGMCWSPNQHHLYFIEGDTGDGYHTHLLKKIHFKSEEKTTVSGNDLSHIHQLACDSSNQVFWIFREVGGVGEVIEYKNSPDSSTPQLTETKRWKVPEGHWVTAITSELKNPIFTLKEGVNTHFYRWNEGNPKKFGEVEGFVFGVKGIENSERFWGIWDRDDRYELWEFNLASPKARKRVAVTGGINSFDRVGNHWAVTSYEHGGWDIALASDAKTQSILPPKANRTVFRKTASTTISKQEEYSPWSSLIPQTWVPSLLFVPDGLQVSAYIPGFDVSQKHNYSLFLGYDFRFPSGGASQSSGFASLGYSYRFGRSSSVYWSSFFFPEYIVSSQLYLTRWGSSLGFSTNWLGLTWSLGPELRKLEAASSITSSNQSTGVGLGVAWQEGFESAPLAVAPRWGTQISLAHSQYFKAMGSTDNYFRSQLNLDQYLPAPWWERSSFYIRGRVGYTEGSSRINSFYQGGGELFISQGRSAFQNRGFPAGVFFARRIFTLSVDYLFPILRVDRGIGLWPIFLTRVTGAIVADGSTSDLGPLDSSPQRFFQRYFGSYGAEIKSDWTIGYYLPVSIRLGLYSPVDAARYNLPNLRFVVGFSASLL